MENRDQDVDGKKRDLVTPVSCLIGAGTWWFFSGAPSTVALILAGTCLAYLSLGFCVLAVSLPQTEPPPQPEYFYPPPPSETDL